MNEQRNAGGRGSSAEAAGSWRAGLLLAARGCGPTPTLPRPACPPALRPDLSPPAACGHTHAGRTRLSDLLTQQAGPAPPSDVVVPAEVTPACVNGARQGGGGSYLDGGRSREEACGTTKAKALGRPSQGRSLSPPSASAGRRSASPSGEDKGRRRKSRPRANSPGPGGHQVRGGGDALSPGAALRGAPDRLPRVLMDAQGEICVRAPAPRRCGGTPAALATWALPEGLLAAVQAGRCPAQRPPGG